MNDTSGDFALPVQLASGELLAALGRLLTALSGQSPDDLSEDPAELRTAAEQVDQATTTLERLTSFGKNDFGILPSGPISIGVSEAKGPSLPDPRLLRTIVRQRRLREQFFGRELFSDPVWDMLLDLMAAYVERRNVSVSALCHASCAPMSTALRWIDRMIEAGLVERIPDSSDHRRIFVSLTTAGANIGANLFAEIGKSQAIVI